MDENINIFDIDRINKRLSEEAKRKRQKYLVDLRNILKTPEGRRFFWRLWTICGLYRNPFVPGSDQTDFNAGRMSIGQEILLDVMEAKPSAFAQIQQEYISILHSKNKEAESGT